ncbi:hypothetical protein Hanom_Chr09g00837221 [Helianthus anomalus]
MTSHFVRNGTLVNVTISHEMAISLETPFRLNQPFRMKVTLVETVHFALNVQFDPLHNIFCVYDEKLPKMAALTDQHLVFRSHIECFWKNAKYDEENKVITSIVSLNGEDKAIVITEQLVREVLDFPDDEDSPTKFPERMVKGCMLRMGYNGPLNSANYFKSLKGGYDVTRDYQMNMVTTLVLNKKYNFSKSFSFT